MIDSAPAGRCRSRCANAARSLVHVFSLELAVPTPARTPSSPTLGEAKTKLNSLSHTPIISESVLSSWTQVRLNNMFSTLPSRGNDLPPSTPPMGRIGA